MVATTPVTPPTSAPQQHEAATDETLKTAFTLLHKALDTSQQIAATFAAKLPAVEAHTTNLVRQTPFSITTIFSEATKITASVISTVATLYLQQSLFDPSFANLSFYRQIRSGLLDQAFAGGIIGISIPFIYLGFRKVFCCNSNPTNIKIFQGATTAIAGVSIIGLGLTLSARALHKIDKAIALHEYSQKEICKSNAKGFIPETIKLIWEYFGPSSSS